MGPKWSSHHESTLWGVKLNATLYITHAHTFNDDGDRETTRFQVQVLRVLNGQLAHRKTLPNPITKC